MNLRFTIESLESAVGASILCSAASAALFLSLFSASQIPFCCLEWPLKFMKPLQLHQAVTQNKISSSSISRSTLGSAKERWREEVWTPSASKIFSCPEGSQSYLGCLTRLENVWMCFPDKKSVGWWDSNIVLCLFYMSCQTLLYCCGEVVWCSFLFLGGTVPEHNTFNRCNHLWDITSFVYTHGFQAKTRLVPAKKTLTGS